jgi:hypothetical protein
MAFGAALEHDLKTETLLTITQATKHLPTRPAVVTVWRWINRGCRGIRLESIAIGGRRYTSVEALNRFCAATTAAAYSEEAKERARTPRQRQRASERAAAELAREWQ